MLKKYIDAVNFMKGFLMNFKLRNMVAATLAGSVLMGFGTSAMADSTFDLVQALVTKGVLTEEEALPLLKGRENDIQLADKKVKKAAKIGISDAIDNATLYGDIRVRGEYRDGTAPAVGAASGVKKEATKDRYKVTLGVKTESGAFYTDLGLAMGAKGRSDNADFGTQTGTEIDAKQGVFIKTAMIGYKATDWLTLEAGRMKNPLYTTPMVWDADLNVEGLSEQVKFKAGDADVFLTAVQSQYLGVRKTTNGIADANTGTTELLAFQGGARFAINDNTSAKAALTYSTYTKELSKTKFGSGTTFALTNVNGINDLDTIEIPAEINYMASSNVGVRLYGDYVYNTSADDRAKNSKLAKALNGSEGSDDSAWLLGVVVGSANDLKAFEGNKMVKGDWQARVWYQDVGLWSTDASLVDSDIFDSRVNMKGTTFKAQYNVQDNVAINFAYAHGKKKNDDYYAVGAGDIGSDLNKFNLFQLDLTYKF